MMAKRKPRCVSLLLDGGGECLFWSLVTTMSFGVAFVIGAFLFGSVVLALPNQDLGHQTERLIGGSEITNKAKHPWMARMEGSTKISLFKEKTTYCGGTLISKKWLVSAAHCFTGDSSVEDASKWTASVGSLHPYDWVHRYLLSPIGWLINKPEWRSWKLKVDRIFRHPDFVNQPMFDNDIALLKLKDEAPVGQHPYVNVLALPTAGNDSVPNENSSCQVTGWGCTSDGGSVQDQEQEMAIPILPRSRCLAYWSNISENQFCAGAPNGGKSVCSGDSGGPLECLNGSTPYFAGIISFADRDHPERYPSGFLNVARYVDWINQIMANN